MISSNFTKSKGDDDGESSSSWAEEDDGASDRIIWSMKGKHKRCKKVDMKTKWSKSTKQRSAQSATTSSTEDDEGEMQQTTSSVIKSRALYCCTLCGLPLKGHVCQYRRTKPVPHYVAGAMSGPPSHHRAAQVASSGSIDNEAWTEVMAPAHILQDEVHSCLLQIAEQEQSQSPTDLRRRLATKNITDAENSFLETWAINVHDELLKQNQLTLENIELSDARRNIAKSVSQERDALVALRAKIRRVQSESQQLEECITTQRQENGTNTAASCFLDAVDMLRRTD